jgi:uncharacterized membrane-anchored protein YhcB (DUF1043 family)
MIALVVGVIIGYVAALLTWVVYHILKGSSSYG